MLETGRIIAIEEHAVWVETQQKTACGNCIAKKGCGQSLLAGLHPDRMNQLKISLAGYHGAAPKLHDTVSFEVPEHALLQGAMRVYLIPLLLMFLGPALAVWQQWGELVQISLAGAGLFAGFVLLRWLDSRASGQAYTPRFVKIVS